LTPTNQRANHHRPGLRDPPRQQRRLPRLRPAQRCLGRRTRSCTGQRLRPVPRRPHRLDLKPRRTCERDRSKAVHPRCEGSPRRHWPRSRGLGPSPDGRHCRQKKRRCVPEASILRSRHIHPDVATGTGPPLKGRIMAEALLVEFAGVSADSTGRSTKSLA
jgi:hypothetical protein